MKGEVHPNKESIRICKATKELRNYLQSFVYTHSSINNETNETNMSFNKGKNKRGMKDGTSTPQRRNSSMIKNYGLANLSWH